MFSFCIWRVWYFFIQTAILHRQLFRKLLFSAQTIARAVSSPLAAQAGIHAALCLSRYTEGSDPGHSAVSGRLCHCRSDGVLEAGIKCRGKDVFGTEFILCNKTCDRFCRCDLHGIIDIRGAHIHRRAEDAGEAQNVVDLVGIIGASCGDDSGAGSFCLVGIDLRDRIGAGKNDGRRRR